MSSVETFNLTSLGLIFTSYKIKKVYSRIFKVLFSSIKITITESESMAFKRIICRHQSNLFRIVTSKPLDVFFCCLNA